MKFYYPYFIHPWPLGCVTVTALNDHIFKFYLPSTLTGKLSDFTGLFFTPLFLCVVFDLFNASFSYLRHKKFQQSFLIKPKTLFFAILLTDTGFILINVHPWSRDLYQKFLYTLSIHSQVTSDFTDLVALISNLLTYHFASYWFDKESKLK